MTKRDTDAAYAQGYMAAVVDTLRFIVPTNPSPESIKDFRDGVLTSGRMIEAFKSAGKP